MTGHSPLRSDSPGVQDGTLAGQAESTRVLIDFNDSTTEYILRADEGPQLARLQPSIAGLATTFIDNAKVSSPTRHRWFPDANLRVFLHETLSVCHMITDFAKLRFGDPSQEMATICGTLSEFKRSRISKREALLTISNTLGTNRNLKRDLMKVLEHRDSRWGPDDFDLPLIPIEPPTPQFLQPVHEPQMRFPSLSAPWSSNNTLLTALGPQAMSGLDRNTVFERSTDQQVPIAQNISDPWSTPSHAILSSPVAPILSLEPPHVHLTSSAIDHGSSIRPYSQLEGDSGSIVTCLEQNMLQQAQHPESWDVPTYGNSWSRGQAQDSHEVQSLRDGQHTSSQNTFEPFRVEIPLLHRRSESVTAVSPRQPLTASPVASSVQPTMLRESHVAHMPIHDPEVEMSPPSRKRSRKSSMLQHSVDDTHANGSAAYNFNVREGQLAHARLSKGSRKNSSPSRNRSDGGGQYIHSLCGKGFGKRASVKKHHWGNKNDDLDTTTGCWYKHRKPKVAWDDHPSCKDGPKQTPLKSCLARSASEDSKALVVPAMVPSYRNIIPGFPTLQVSPHTVAQAIGSAHAPSLSVQDGALYNSRAQENYLSYHSHGLPRTTTSLSSPFESLLTAVNVAARIEEPTPSKGRNDSVIICNLDAQAIAAERTGQHLPAWNFDPGHGDVGVDQYGEYVPSPTDYNVGVGLPSPMGHVPTSMTFSSKMDHTGYNSPILPSIVSDPIYMHQHAFMQPYRHIAPDLRFCLEPAFD
jgi:hypothetical protein